MLYSYCRYFQLLDSANISMATDAFKPITSLYLPANAKGNGLPAEVIQVERISLPPIENRGRSSHLLDVMEVRLFCGTVKYTHMRSVTNVCEMTFGIDAYTFYFLT